ncbi:MAG: hypothetical protein AAF431_16600 [Pseudomonadota bacterium]
MRDPIRNVLIAILLLNCSVAVADQAEWYVVVYGENHLITLGASADADVVDGKFLSEDFSGKEIFVHTHQDYSLAQFRKKETTYTANTVSSEDAAVAASTPEEAEPTTEFGPLADSGLTIFSNGDFTGWYCDQLYVTPVGSDRYKLRCDKEMTRQ